MRVNLDRWRSAMIKILSIKKVNNRISRDFLENKRHKSKMKFVKFLSKKNVYLPPNGIILFSFMTSKKSINYVINSVCEGLDKYFK